VLLLVVLLFLRGDDAIDDGGGLAIELLPDIPLLTGRVDAARRALWDPFNDGNRLLPSIYFKSRS
jgi:hypothetical protein